MEDKMVVRSANERDMTVTAYASDDRGNTDLLGKEYVMKDDGMQTRMATDRDGLVTGTVRVKDGIRDDNKRTPQQRLHDPGYFTPDQKGNSRYTFLNRMREAVEDARTSLVNNMERLEQEGIKMEPVARQGR